MPKIKDLDAKQRALKDVKAGLKDLESINHFLNASSADNTFVISFQTADGSKVSATAFTENKEEIDLLIMNHRERIVNDINYKAQKYTIEFDEHDLMILENEPSAIEEIAEMLEEDSQEI